MAVSDFSDQALLYLNDIYQQVYSGGSTLIPEMQEDWWWLYATSPIFLQPAYDVGTLSLTNGSSSVVISPAPAVDLMDYWLRIGTYSDPFQVKSVYADTLILDAAWPGATLPAESFIAFRLDYQLPADMLRILQPMQVHRGARPEIDGISSRELAEQFPLSICGSGIPRNFAMINVNTVRFSHYGNSPGGEPIRVDVPYLHRPPALTADDDTMPLPLEYRTILSDFVTYRILLDKNDSRADAYGASARGRLMAMRQENRRHWRNMRKDIASVIYRPGQDDTRLRTVSGLRIR